MTKFREFMAWFGKGLKAFASAFAAGLFYLAGVWQGSNLSVGEAIGSLTAEHWSWFILAVLGAWGITYGTRNR